MNDDEYYGRKLSVSVEPKEYEAFVKGFSPASTEESIRTHFSGCGAIVRVKLRPGEEGKSKGSAFIVVGTQEALGKALKLDGKELDGQRLSVTVADQQSKAKGKDKGKGKGKGKASDKGKGKGKKGKGKRK